MDAFRRIGRKVRHQVQHYPQRRPRTWRTSGPPLDQHAPGEVEVDPSGLDIPVDHRDLMVIVATVVILLALSLVAAIAALLLRLF